MSKFKEEQLKKTDDEFWFMYDAILASETDEETADKIWKDFAKKMSQVIDLAFKEGKKEGLFISHETESGFCCACDYDIAVMNKKIEEAKQKIFDKYLVLGKGFKCSKHKKGNPTVVCDKCWVEWGIEADKEKAFEAGKKAGRKEAEEQSISVGYGKCERGYELGYNWCKRSIFCDCKEGLEKRKRIALNK